MSAELDEIPAPQTETVTPDEKPGRRIWPLLAWCAVGGVIVVTGAVAALGVTGALIAGGCTAGALAGGAVLWRLPQLRKHFARRGGARMRSSQSRTRRMSLGGSRKGKLPGLGAGGRKGRSSMLGGKGRSALGRGKAAGGRLGKALTGKSRAAGKGALGRLGKSRAGKLLGRAGKGLTGKGRGSKSGGGKNGAASGRRHGLIRRGVGSAWRGLTGRSARRRAAAGKGPAGGKKPSSGRKRAGIAGAALLPAIGAVAAVRRARTWIRKRGGKGATPPAAQAEPEAAAAEKPPDAPPGRKPGLPLAPNSTDHPSRRRHPVTSHLDAITEAIDSGIGGFEPENVDHLGAFLQSLPGVYEALTSGLNRLADRFGDELPLHPAVVEHIREMASSAAGLFEYSNEAYGIFRSSHEDDLERLENPRPGEEFMDASKQ